MRFKFNGGRGAILCSKCGIILKQGNQIQYILLLVRNLHSGIYMRLDLQVSFFIRIFALNNRFNHITKEEKKKIMESDAYKAAKIAFMNGCCKAYGLEEMAHYMFLEGIKYQKTGIMPQLLN